VIQFAVVGLSKDDASVVHLNKLFYAEMANAEETAFFPDSITKIYNNSEERLKSVSELPVP